MTGTRTRKARICQRPDVSQAFQTDESDATASEYGLIVADISVAIIGVLEQPSFYHRRLLSNPDWRPPSRGLFFCAAPIGARWSGSRLSGPDQSPKSQESGGLFGPANCQMNAPARGLPRRREQSGRRGAKPHPRIEPMDRPD
jgi:hypothetical protein